MRKHRLIDMTGLIIAGSVAAAAAAPIWDPADGVVFPPDKAASLFSQQCSRERPKGITGYWTPQADQIANIEQRLPAILEQAIQHYVKMDTPRHVQMPNYLRQYAGLVESHDHKIIYVNGFLADKTSPGDGEMRKTDWRTRAFMTCDGFINYFGIEYDPETKTFTGLKFNFVG
jgi:hypothetical protein